MLSPIVGRLQTMATLQPFQVFTAAIFIGQTNIFLSRIVIYESYYCRIPNSKQNKTNPMPLDPKLMKDLGIIQSPKIGGFLG